MPRYYFDCVDDQGTHADAYGIELPNVQEAADHAAMLVATMLGEQLATNGMRAISVVVRTDEHRTVYVAHATFHGYVPATTAV